MTTILTCIFCLAAYYFGVPGWGCIAVGVLAFLLELEE